MADIEPKPAKKDSKKRMVKALFSYIPENTDELPLKVNDILEVIEETEEGWWKGILNGNVGMFPSNFVIQLDHFPEELNNQSMNELSPTKNANEAKHFSRQEPLLRQGENNHSVVNKSELNLNPKSINAGNDIDGSLQIAKPGTPIPFDKKVMSSAKRTGIPPLADCTAPQLPPKPIREQARVMFPYVAQNEDELTLKDGDIITVICKEIEDKGWWKGELNNRIGVFPDNFVELVKVDEPKKPERPDKPSTVVSSKATSRTTPSEKHNPDSSPKHEKKLSKNPPAKPPPPDILKKEEKPDRPALPYLCKKPQLPPPMKKPLRSSLGSKISASINILKSPVSERGPINSENKPEACGSIKNQDKTTEVSLANDNKQSKKDELCFDVVEASSDKLVHLTASRAKAPNRRPPSHIFLKENEKENDLPSYSRRVSEPLLTEVKLLLPKETEPLKVSSISTSEIKTKSPPSRPSPPNVRNSITNSLQFDAVNVSAKSETASEISIPKATETVKKTAVVPDTQVPTVKSEVFHPKTLTPASNTTTEAEILQNDVKELKTSLSAMKDAMVSRSEFNDLLNLVSKLRDVVEAYKDNVTKLKGELEQEKKLRIAFESELEQIRQLKTA